MMKKQFTLSLNENGELALSKGLLDAADWKPGEIIQAAYNGAEDTLTLVNFTNCSVLDENGTIAIPGEMLNDGSFQNGCEFTAVYSEEADTVVLTPVSKACAVCGETQNTLPVGNGRHICPKCRKDISQQKTA